MEQKHWLLPEGISETLPPQANELEHLRRTLLDLYRSWGYELVFPPFVEYLDSLLTGTGGDLNLQTFKLTDQVTGRTLGIRADITPQVARIDAHQLRRDCPTRLCYQGTVLHSRSDTLASSRSPLQIGAELYGHAGVEAELEIIGLMIESLQRSGIGDIFLDLGHVGIFRGLAGQAGFNQVQEHALFNALQRKAVPEIRKLLTEYGTDKAVAEMLIALAELSGEQVLSRSTQVLAGANQSVHNALDELNRLAALLQIRYPTLAVHYDLAELRGYHYHTGVMFAAYVPGIGQEVARGGRYDDIGQLFGRARPACGFSADLNMLLKLGSRVHPADQSILAPAVDDPLLMLRIQQLREEGRPVIQALPGQSAAAGEMGCSEILEKRGEDWVVVTTSFD
ncbi:MAG: ATP phosphoribosyltransferase regulatory subunit [Gammaproteobacteria bacterium]|nr:ATP phosphoribosyltransferase regulatory subunit [Gammaproteobacteria bacterium]MCP5407620.1 ATP phosphoribosyltransferase regulatory subunit [Chromatiaceae bacterium]